MSASGRNYAAVARFCASNVQSRKDLRTNWGQIRLRNQRCRAYRYQMPAISHDHNRLPNQNAAGRFAITCFTNRATGRKPVATGAGGFLFYGGRFRYRENTWAVVTEKRSTTRSLSRIVPVVLYRTRPGFSRFFGSNSRLIRRIRSSSMSDLTDLRRSRFRRPMPCSAEMLPPKSPTMP